MKRKLKGTNQRQGGKLMIYNYNNYSDEVNRKRRRNERMKSRTSEGYSSISSQMESFTSTEHH